jgi:hypothetical protein
LVPINTQQSTEPRWRGKTQKNRGGERKDEIQRRKEQKTGEQKIEKNQRKGESITNKNTRAQGEETKRSKGKKNILRTRPSLSSSSPPSSSPGKAFLFSLFLHILLQKKKTG